MARPREHLRKAPIVEAVIDFRVARQEGLTSESFANLGASLGAGYSRSSLIQALEGRFGMEKGKPIDPTIKTAALGWQYRSGGAVAQFRIDGFTFSKLEPYTTWGDVFQEAYRLWDVYVEAAHPAEVTRVAVRYINRLHVPGPVDLGEYLEAPPILPPPIPQQLREFLSRVVLEDTQRRASAIVVQASEPAMEPSTVLILLDIDAFKELTLPPKDASLPGVFEQLRSLKNNIFFASVTEKTVEMYA